jgi:hypothetical protein
MFKSKYRNKLNPEDDLRLYLTKLEPNIDQLCQQKQANKKPNLTLLTNFFESKLFMFITFYCVLVFNKIKM